MFQHLGPVSSGLVFSILDLLLLLFIEFLVMLNHLTINPLVNSSLKPRSSGNVFPLPVEFLIHLPHLIQVVLLILLLLLHGLVVLQPDQKRPLVHLVSLEVQVLRFLDQRTRQASVYLRPLHVTCLDGRTRVVAIRVVRQGRLLLGAMYT